MEKIKITIEYNAEKYKALSKFAEKKGIDVNGELCAQIDKLYKKNVPTAVQEFIEG